MHNLRQELDRLAAEALSLARWKLIAVAAVVVTALGWNDKTSPDSLSALLLLSTTGFLCAYTDSLLYRRLSATHVIASYLRQNPASDQETLSFRAYEGYVNQCRRSGLFFLSDHILAFATSAVFSVGPFLLGYLARSGSPDPSECKPRYWLYGTIPVAALMLNFIMFLTYRKKRRQLVEEREAVPPGRPTSA